MIYHLINYQKYSLVDRIDPSKVGVRNRANITAALRNRRHISGHKGFTPTGRSTLR